LKARGAELFAGATTTEAPYMTVLFTIELRVACDHDNKYVLATEMIRQAALQAYKRVALMDEGEKPHVVVYAHDYEYGHRDIPLMDFSPEEHAEIAAMSVHLAEALLARRPPAARKPVLRVVEGGRRDPWTLHRGERTNSPRHALAPAPIPP
jgi:hypothetical protein